MCCQARHFRFTVLFSLLFATVTAASSATFFPLEAGAFWTLTDPDVPSTMHLALTGTQFFHGVICMARNEIVDGVTIGTTFWSEDDQGRIVLHGVQYLTGATATFYFSPGFVYLDPSVEPGEVVTSLSHVFEVGPDSDLWRGELTVQTTCFDRDGVTTPFGTFPAITVNTTWVDSPQWAPWKYGNDGRITYALGIGMVRVVELDGGFDWLLSAMQNIDMTDVPQRPDLALSAAPNPFNPQTSLRFTLPEAGRVRLDVVDARGRKVVNLIAANLPAGPHAVAWRGTDAMGRPVASGVYRAVLSTGGGQRSLAVTLVQ